MTNGSFENPSSEELKTLVELRDSGLLSEEEFFAEKTRILENPKVDETGSGLYVPGSYQRTPTAGAASDASGIARANLPLKVLRIYLRVNLMIITLGLSELIFYIVRRRRVSQQ